MIHTVWVVYLQLMGNKLRTSVREMNASSVLPDGIKWLRVQVCQKYFPQHLSSRQLGPLTSERIGMAPRQFFQICAPCSRSLMSWPTSLFSD